MVDEDSLYSQLQSYGPKCKSLLKKYLTQGVFDNLKNKTTSYGGTLADCIRSGCLHMDNVIGLYASDPDAYDAFSDIFDPIITDYHDVSELKHPEPDLGDLKNLTFADLDPSGGIIISTTIRMSRSIVNYGFPPTLRKEDREDMENETVEALKALQDELKGSYYPLLGMTQEDKKKMDDDHFLFQDDDRFLRDANVYDDWPVGRGIFTSEDKKFLVWVNEEDHLRIISTQQDGNLAEVWERQVKGLKSLEKELTFSHHYKYGYLTFCPTNIGTTCRASIRIKIPNLSKHKDFNDICERLYLQTQELQKGDSESKGGVYDISNKRRLGLTEIETLEELSKGVVKIIELEKKLASGGKI